MDLDQLVSEGGASRRAFALAEFAHWSFIVSKHAEVSADIDRRLVGELRKQLAQQETTLHLAQAVGLTEGKVWSIVTDHKILTQKTPGVWAAFSRGDINGVRVAAIADTVARLKTTRALDAVEATAPDYAAGHTVAELRAWLRRLRARLEPQDTATETAEALEDRKVTITHNDDPSTVE